MGLICRHIFHICLIKNEFTLERLCISDRWRKSFESENDHFQSLNVTQPQERILEIVYNKENGFKEDEFEVISSSEDEEGAQSPPKNLEKKKVIMKKSGQW